MLQRLVLFLTVLCLACLAPQRGYAETKDGYNTGDWQRCTTGVFKNAISVSATNTQLTFTRDSKALYIKNTGDTNEMYVDPRDGTAAATDDDGGIKIEAGKDIELSQFQTHKLGLIASSGETTTAQVIACW